MSDFVDYNKRSVTLPEGCNDLIDVLRRGGRKLDWLERHLGIDLSRAITRGGAFRGAFTEIEHKIQQAVTASTLIFIFKIEPTDQRFTFTLHRLYQRPLQALIEVHSGTPQEAALCASLAAHKLRAPYDAKQSKTLFPDLPWRLKCPIEPLPENPLVLSRLISGLLRDVGALTPATEISFQHHEVVASA